jgi:sec-independent protein translocase protein TatA
MGLDNPIHIAFLLVLLLLVFGAKRLPEMGRSLGGGLRGFRDALSGDVRSAAVPAPVPARASVTAADAASAHIVGVVPVAAEAVPGDSAGRVGASGEGSDEPLAAA